MGKRLNEHLWKNLVFGRNVEHTNRAAHSNPTEAHP
jgi:hypothetical protein